MQLGLRLDIVVTWNPPHPTPPLQLTFRPLLDKLENSNLAQALTRLTLSNQSNQLAQPYKANLIRITLLVKPNLPNTASLTYLNQTNLFNLT